MFEKASRCVFENFVVVIVNIASIGVLHGSHVACAWHEQ